MNNQILLWGMLIIPWLTIFLIKKEELKRFIPATLFTVVTSGIIYEVGIVAKFWYFKAIAFPVVMYGLFSIAGLWILKFTYGRFLIYVGVNLVLDLGFAFVIIPWFEHIGILGVGYWTSLIVYIINFFHALSIYGYQMWQEEQAYAA